MFKMSSYLKRIIEYTKKQNDDNNYFALWYKENGSYYMHATHNDKKVIPVFQNIRVAQKVLGKSDRSIKDNYVLVPISYNNPFGTTTNSLFVITEDDDMYIDKDYCLYIGSKINLTAPNTIGDLILRTNSDVDKSVIIRKEKTMDIINASHPDNPIIISFHANKIDNVITMPLYVEDVELKYSAHAFFIPYYDRRLTDFHISIIYVSAHNKLILYFDSINRYIEIHNVCDIILER